MNPLRPVGIVLDAAALLALDTGNSDAAYLVSSAPDYYRALYASVASLYAANQARPSLARRVVGHLDAIHPTGIDTPSIVEMADRAPQQAIDLAHVVHLALPSREWPDGRAIATTTPQLYQAHPIALYEIDN